ncbi:MAG: hypothetical protein JSR77_18310 [Planctomycetes bacterium]|nr:hypothetical protein [Planctomycetota bacterium]
MPPIPTRVSNWMVSRLSQGNLNRTSLALFGVQQQITTGRSVLRPSDDVVKAATIGVIDDRLDRSAQLQRNFEHASAAVNEIDSTLNEANQIALQAKSIAAEQINLTASASERSGQASVVDGLLRGLFNVANRSGVAGYVLGGTQAESAPVVPFLGGYRYVGRGDGLTTDLGLGGDAPITLGGNNPIARASSRVKGTVDFAPALTAQTRLAEIRGARGGGLQSGTVQFSFDGGQPTTVDLSGAETIGDVRLRLESALRKYETDNGVTILDSSGVSLQGESLNFGVVSGAPAPTLEFFDSGSGTTARDLGLTGSTPTQFTSTSPSGASLDPALAWNTPLSAMAGITGALGTIRISNAGHTTTVDLSGAQSLQDVRNLIEGTNLGLRVQINSAGTGIDVLNEVAAGSINSLSISEVSGGDTATRLGIRTMSGDTRLSDFNFGRGVSIVNGVNDPSTGTATSSLNEDFIITLGDSARTQISIDLRPQDVTTVQAVIDRINSQASAQIAASGLPAGSLVAGLASDGNGLRLTQSGAFTNALSIQARNNSQAAQDLGLTAGTYDASSASLIGEDRAKVRTDSLFTQLIDLRDSLTQNSTTGIGFAGSGMEVSIGEIAELRGIVGGHAQRIDSAATRETDRATLDETIRTGLRDADFTQAATQFSLLQTQLEAGLRVAAISSQRTLLDFLG